MIRIKFSELFRKLLNRSDVVDAFASWESKLHSEIVLYDLRGEGLQDVRTVFQVTPFQESVLKGFFKDELSVEDNDEKVLAIAKRVNGILKYSFDKNRYGKAEWWADPYSVFVGGVDDCDGYAVLIYKLMILAGIPEFRRRLVAGSTPIGGHAYVVYWSEKWNAWFPIEGSYYAPESLYNLTEGLFPVGENKRYGSIWFSTTENKSFIKKVGKIL